jgi:DNA-binding IclR family transcriptional regulator
VSKIDNNKSTTALKAFEVLEAVAASSQPVSVQDVAEQVGTDKATVYRMLMTLVEAGYVLRG